MYNGIKQADPFYFYIFRRIPIKKNNKKVKIYTFFTDIQ